MIVCGCCGVTSIDLACRPHPPQTEGAAGRHDVLAPTRRAPAPWQRVAGAPRRLGRGRLEQGGRGGGRGGGSGRGGRAVAGGEGGREKARREAGCGATTGGAGVAGGAGEGEGAGGGAPRPQGGSHPPPHTHGLASVSEIAQV